MLNIVEMVVEMFSSLWRTRIIAMCTLSLCVDVVVVAIAGTLGVHSVFILIASRKRYDCLSFINEKRHSVATHWRNNFSSSHSRLERQALCKLVELQQTLITLKARPMNECDA